MEFYYPSYLPEGYVLERAEMLNDTKYMYFNNSEGQKIRFIQGNMSSQSQIDTQDGRLLEVDINGNDGLIATKEGISILSWSDDGTSFSIQGSVEQSILLEIAEGIKKNK